MKHFIVIQIAIVKEEIVENIKNTIIESIVRQVKAESKEVAIEKFVIGTQDIKAIKKLDIECYDLSDLKSADSPNSLYNSITQQPHSPTSQTQT